MKYLGVDFGLRRIGLATSDGEIAAPFKTIEVRSFKDAVKQVLEICQREGFEKIIVGLPEGKIGQTVAGFIKALKKRGLDIQEADETLSSQRALEQMVELNVPKEKRRSADDVAAAIILQNWLDLKEK